MVDHIRVKVKDRWYTVEVGDLSASTVEVLVDGELFQVELEGLGDATESLAPYSQRRGPRRPMGLVARAVSETLITSPMPGRIVSVSVTEGQTIAAGDEVCILETMKMEQSIQAPQAGVIKAVKVTPDQSVAAGDILVELE